MKSGQEQVSSILAAVRVGENGFVASQSHKLKSAARMVGALQLAELCQQLETAGGANDGKTCIELGGRLEEKFSTAMDLINQSIFEQESK